MNKKIENIIKKHSLVKDVVVIQLKNNIKDIKSYAFVISPNKEKHIIHIEKEIKEHILKQLKLHHCPERIWVLDDFPLSKSNKIDKNQLKKLAKNFIQWNNNKHEVVL